MANNLIFSLSHLDMNFNCQNPHPVIDADLSLLDGSFLVSTPDLNILTNFPEINFSSVLNSGAVISLDVTLGWPAMNSLQASLVGANQMAMDMTLLEATINMIVGNVIQINEFMPSSVFHSSVTSELIGTVDITVPSIEGLLSIQSESIGRIAGILPALTYNAPQMAVGGVIHLAADLPLPYYDSVLLTNGIIQINIQLPVLLYDAYGHISSGSLQYNTIVMNTLNFGVTEYDTVELKGMTSLNGNTIAIHQNSLVKVGPTLDDNQHINALMRTGTIDFSSPYWVKPRDIWIELRSGKRIRLTIKDNENNASPASYISEDFVEELHKTRVKVGRGFYSEFFDFTIENVDGELIDITNVHIFSDPVKGRKR